MAILAPLTSASAKFSPTRFGGLARPGLRGLLAVLAVVLGAGCEDLRQFAGPWHGNISPDPNHQHGFDRQAALTIDVGGVSRHGIDLTLTLPGTTGSSRFEPIRHVVQDVLADLRLPGDPLRTYLGFIRTPGEEPYLAVVSLYAEGRIEVRLIRGPDTAYGVFMLGRRRADAATRTD